MLCICIQFIELVNVSLHRWPAGRKGPELQQPAHPLPLSAHFHHGHHHAVFPPQRLLQPGQPGSSLLWHYLLHPLPPAHLLLCLAGPHHQRHEDPGKFAVPSGVWLWDGVPVAVRRAGSGSAVGQHPDQPSGGRRVLLPHIYLHDGPGYCALRCAGLVLG
ncbi:hypothetical protein PAMA_008768 [Pampus argenteus]